MVPRCAGCRVVIAASRTSRDSRQRNTLGRTLSLGFRVSATTTASGRAAWATALPTCAGMGTIPPGMYVSVLRYSSPQAAPTLRRMDRSRVAVRSRGTAGARRRSAMAAELIGSQVRERPGSHGGRAPPGRDRRLSPSPRHLPWLLSLSGRRPGLDEGRTGAGDTGQGAAPTTARASSTSSSATGTPPFLVEPRRLLHEGHAHELSSGEP